MKRVIEDSERETICRSEVSVMNFIGAEHKSGERGFVIRQGYEKGPFYIASVGNEFTDGNGWTCGEDYSHNLHSFMREMAKVEDPGDLPTFTFYVFTSFVDLSNWVNGYPQKKKGK